MQSIAQLETIAASQPNSVEIKHSLAERYIEQGRWEEAARTYQALACLHTSTASLFTHRIRLGAAALTIASSLIFISAVMQPPLLGENPAAFSRTISLPGFAGAQVLLMIALALYSCSAISIYKLLSYSADHRPAFWAMVASVIGVGLSMPSLGIKSFVFPIIGNTFLDGGTDVMEIFLSLGKFPFNIYLGMGDYLLILGMGIFAWVIWRNRGLSLSAILVFLAGWLGWVITSDRAPHSILITFAALIAVGGVGLGLSLWNQASTQFDPSMDRSAGA